jgi:hypothetical protein
MLSTTISSTTFLASLLGLLGYFLLESQFHIGIIANFICTIYLMFKGFYILPFLFLMMHCAGVWNDHQALSTTSMALTLIHVLCSYRPKIMEIKSTILKEDLVMIGKSKVCDSNTNNEKVTPVPLNTTELQVETISESSAIYSDDEYVTAAMESPEEPAMKMVRRPKSSLAKEIIAAARSEARAVEEQRKSQIIQDRYSSPAKESTKSE